MPVDYDQNSYTPLRTAIYRATADYFFGTLYALRNHVEYHGRENVPAEPCVVVPNHLSNWDPPLVAAACRIPIAYLAKKELYTDRFFEHLVRFYGSISLDRDKPEVSTFKAVKFVIEKGWSVGAFIEGTRSKTPAVLGPPFPGPAFIARANKLKILPVGVIGTNIKGGKYIVRIGKPMEPGKDIDATTWAIMDELSSLTGFALPARAVAD